MGRRPDALDELNDFDDYAKLLVTHELTHVVHLDTMLSPCTRLINTLEGRTYAPNLAEPTWLVEGLAVLMESRQTTGGRLRSSFYDMHLRVPFLEGRLFGLDQVTNIPLAYPGGTAAYLYGSGLIRYIEDRYGPEKIREISHRYADTCFPGGINRVARDAVGRGYAGVFGAGLFDDWQRAMAHRFALEVEDAARRPLTAATRLTWDAPGPRGEGPGPRYLPDGTVVYHRANNDQWPGVRAGRPRHGPAEHAGGDGRHRHRRPDARRRGADPGAGRLLAGPVPDRRQRGRLLERPLPLRHRDRGAPAAHEGVCGRTSPTCHPTAAGSRASCWARAAAGWR